MPALTLLVLYCSDIDASRDFYTGLGLRFTEEQHGGGPTHYAAVLGGGCVLELYPAGAGGVTRTRLGLRGAVGAGTTVTDPDGNTIELEASSDTHAELAQEYDACYGGEPAPLGASAAWAGEEPVEHLTVASLHGLCEGWPPSRPVWIQSRGGALEQAVWGDHLERGGDGEPALVLRSWAPGDEPTAAATVWVLEWAGPQGVSCPATTAHRTEAGALAAIAAEAKRVGVEPVEGETTPGGMRTVWVGMDLVAMVRALELGE